MVNQTGLTLQFSRNLFKYFMIHKYESSPLTNAPWVLGSNFIIVILYQKIC